MTRKAAIPNELLATRNAALEAIAPIRPTDQNTTARKDTLLSAQRSSAGQKLPDYYLVYFLLVELLGFEDLGRSEKIAWSVPIDFQRKAYLIEHRKFGVGIFVQDPEIDEPACQTIVDLIKHGIRAAEPFFSWLAKQALSESILNVVNDSTELFGRYQYFLKTYRHFREEAERRSEERITEKHVGENGNTWTSVSIPAYELRKQAQWTAQAAVDAFFSWTEHVFIHMTILNGSSKTGSEVAKLATASWYKKFASALDLADAQTKDMYEKLSSIKEQLRNFMAHGAFGKRGKHSASTPVLVLFRFS